MSNLRDKAHLKGVDIGRMIREGAANLMERAVIHGIERERKAAHDKLWTPRPDLVVETFQVRDNPPMWRMETRSPLNAGIGVVKVYDADPRFLKAEMRVKLVNLLLLHGVAEDMTEARGMVGRMTIFECKRVMLKDSLRFEGER